MTARKTVKIEDLLAYANGFLCARGGTPESRYAIICMIEHALNLSNRYRGYCYLSEDEVHHECKPGIRWKEYHPNEFTDTRFRDTDNTRRRYA